MRRATVWHAGGMVFVMATVFALLPIRARALGDDTVGDKGIAFRYLDQVEASVGFETYDSVSAPLCNHLAHSLGRLDRDWLTPEAFIGHVRHVEAGMSRFYKPAKLGLDEVTAYLLPYRIRNELTSKPDWMGVMAAHFLPLTRSATTADEAARTVLAWTTGHVKLLQPALSYPLPLRGDLDPLTVLKGGYGNEIDCAVFGVAALRASGVAARLVWAPALRGERGGKVWLEYLGEQRAWVPWVPTFGDAADHRAELRERIGSKILFVMARPEAPLEITGSYAETVDLTIHSSDESLVVQLLVVGRDQLLPARGHEGTRNERHITIGAGACVIAASFGMRSFALLPVECAPNQKTIRIAAESGGLAIAESPETPPLSVKFLIEIVRDSRFLIG
jgi:hypothetical protein